MQYPG